MIISIPISPYIRVKNIELPLNGLYFISNIKFNYLLFNLYP